MLLFIFKRMQQQRLQNYNMKKINKYGDNICAHTPASNQLFPKHKAKISGAPIDKIKKGCLIFWDGHVGVGLNQKDIIHSNAFHFLKTDFAL